MVQHDVLSRYENRTRLVMSTMKITLDAAMRARDVSPPRAGEDRTGADSTVGDSTVDDGTVDDGTGDGSSGGRGPEAAARGRGGGQP